MENERPDRYVSFEGIDCAANAQKVLDIAIQILSREGFGNEFWDLFLKKYNKALESPTKEDDILYLVCSNVYYLEELFEKAESKEGMDAMGLCEYDCC